MLDARRCLKPTGYLARSASSTPASAVTDPVVGLPRLAVVYKVWMRTECSPCISFQKPSKGPF